MTSSIWIDDVVVGEQDGFADFVIRLDGPTTLPVTVDYATANSTASYLSDYVYTSGKLTFAPGETVKTVSVQLDDDLVPEGTEVFTMNLSGASVNATIARAAATATIIDNDNPAPGTPQVSISNLTVDEADGTANFVITLDRSAAGVVSMNYATQDGAPIAGVAAATAGQDYTATSGTLDFAPGETAKTVKVPLINDNLPEGDEGFSLKLSNLVGATALNPVGTAVIGANDEPVISKPSLWIDDLTVGEQDGFATFVIRLDAPTTLPVTVDYATANSTASYLSDYVYTSGKLTFAPGETVKTVSVQLRDDFDREGPEVFTMNLSGPSNNVNIARASAAATIIDNDAPSGAPVASINDLVVDEADGTANFVVTFDKPSTGVVSIDYATQDGTALAGQDYVAQSGTLKFAPGETAKTVKVQLINDSDPEGAEAFGLKLSNLVGATALDPVGTAVIAANDEPVVSKPSITIDDVTVGEQDGFADFVIRLNAPTTAPITVDYATANSTASYLSDYVYASGALTFAPGETVKTVRVQVTDDPDQEGTEVFKMNLYDPSANVSIARASATATIIDNDAQTGTPRVSINDFTVDESDGTANFVITFDRPSAGVVSMNYATQDGTALAGSDYVAAAGTLNFAPGETAKTVKVLLHDDTIHENAETFSLKLSGLVGATTLDPVGTATIDDNDAPATNVSGILWRNASTGGVELWSPNGSGGFTYDNLGTVSTSWQIQATGDFTGNGANDILWRNASTGDVELWNSNGSGGFTYQDLHVVNTSWQVAGTGDFTGDGADGVLWRNASTGGVELWNPNGSGGFTYQSLNPVNTSWQVAGTGDFTGTGDDGILWRNASTGGVELWNSNGSGGFTYEALNPVNTNWQVAGTGDFTGSGEDGILWRNASTGGVELWNPNGSGGFTYEALAPVNTNWQVAGTGDYTGSGADSILWRNASSGAVELWNPNGSGGFTYESSGLRQHKLADFQTELATPALALARNFRLRREQAASA